MESPPEVHSTYAAFCVVVGDPIKNRFVLVNGIHGDRWSHTTDDIWAVDLTTGEWTRILASATSGKTYDERVSRS